MLVVAILGVCASKKKQWNKGYIEKALKIILKVIKDQKFQTQTKVNLGKTYQFQYSNCIDSKSIQFKQIMT
jgi:hypothetical protein